jgi:hypothetical protein
LGRRGDLDAVSVEAVVAADEQPVAGEGEVGVPEVEQSAPLRVVRFVLFGLFLFRDGAFLLRIVTGVLGVVVMLGVVVVLGVVVMLGVVVVLGVVVMLWSCSAPSPDSSPSAGAASTGSASAGGPAGIGRPAGACGS